MSSDLIIPTEDNKSAVLDQIEKLHEKHRLNVLRGVAIEYNESIVDDQLHIDLQKHTTAFDLIFSLWARRVKIPEGIGFGDPYDEIFERAIGLTKTTVLDHLIPVIMIRNPDVVKFFIMSGMRMGDEARSIFKQAVRTLHKDDLLLHGEYTRINVRNILFDKSVTPFDVAYIALMLHREGQYLLDYTIYDLELYAIGLYHC